MRCVWCEITWDDVAAADEAEAQDEVLSRVSSPAKCARHSARFTWMRQNQLVGRCALLAMLIEVRDHEVEVNDAEFRRAFDTVMREQHETLAALAKR